MIKLEVVKIDNYLYELKDENNVTYNLNLEFLDFEEPLQIGNQISMNSRLLDPEYEEYSTSYTFGNLDNKYGKENLTIDDIDVIKIIKDDKEIYLKRLYG